MNHAPNTSRITFEGSNFIIGMKKLKENSSTVAFDLSSTRLRYFIGFLEEYLGVTFEERYYISSEKMKNPDRKIYRRRIPHIFFLEKSFQTFIFGHKSQMCYCPCGSQNSFARMVEQEADTTAVSCLNLPGRLKHVPHVFVSGDIDYCYPYHYSGLWESTTNPQIPHIYHHLAPYLMVIVRQQ